MQFEFATATRIVFGAGKAAEVAPAARRMGSRALLVTGRSADRAAGLADELDAEVFAIPGEPTIPMVEEGVALARRGGCDVVVSLGGGSAIDGGKAIAAILGNGGDPLDYIEVVGKGGKITQASAPFIAVPTTAGTGSEVTRNAVLASPEHRVKASLRSPLMLPRMAVVDPELTVHLPRDVTAATGLDALTQLIEPYVSIRANAMTDMYCLEGMRRAAGALERVCTDGSDVRARTDMAIASLLGGLSLANAGLGAVHGFAAPVGGMFGAPHGAVCAALLPFVMERNLQALRGRSPESPALDRYQVVARILTGERDAAAADGVAWVRRVTTELDIPRLSAYGIGDADIPVLVEKAAKASSMKANPVVLSSGELSAILTEAL
ncbi:MAG: iron-containing alcohol dehydrogenase [bacterium]|nr:iron-containing alcohol dehydrogenase [bacterium]